jgi:hypothetical protein
MGKNMKIVILLLLTFIPTLLCLELSDVYENPYRALKIAPWSTWKEIKAHYNLLAKKYHPDKYKGSNEKFLKIQNAYEKIKEKREDDNGGKKSNLKTEENVEDAKWNYMTDTILIAVIGFISIWFIHFIILLLHKFYRYIWKFIGTYFFVHCIVDRLVGHQFEDENVEYLTIIVLSIGIYKFTTILKYVFKKKEVVEDKKNN